jgi:hypothetical protein
MTIADEPVSIVNEIASALSPSFTYEVITRGESCCEICLEKCIIRIGFERYEPEIASVIFVDPTQRNAVPELHLWIVTKLPGISWHLEPGSRPYFSYGKAILKHFASVLNGDFTVRETYKLMKNTILDEQNKKMSNP